MERTDIETNSQSSESAKADTSTPVEKKSAPVVSGEIKEASDTSKENLDTQDSDESDEGQGTDDQVPHEEGKPRKKGGFEKRIERFQKQLSAKDQEIAQLRQEFLKSQSQGKAETEAPAAKTEDPSKPKPDNFESHEEYLEALTDYKVDKREREREQAEKSKQVKSDFEKRLQAHNERVEKFKETKSDYQDVAEDFLEKYRNKQVSAAIHEAVIESEVGPAIFYELASNQAEFDRINSLGAIAAAKEIGKIEAKLLQSSETKEVKKHSTAPTPIRPVSGKAAPVAKSLHDMDYEDYRKTRLEQMNKNRR